MDALTWDKILEWLNKPFLHIGDTPVTMGSIFSGVFVFGIFVVISFILRHLVIKRLASKFGLRTAVAYSIRRVIHYSLLTLGAIFAIQTAGFSLNSLTVILGFLSVGIGFGLKNITSNFISGVILLFEQPISVGDMITVDNQSSSVVGIVQKIGMRSTLVRTFDNVNIIVPNSQFIEGQVINWSYGDLKVRLHIPIGVAYGSDTKKMTKILLDIAKNHPQVLKDPKPKVWFLEFANSSLNFDLLAWVARPEVRYDVLSDLNYAIDEAFRKEEIQIPFPQRDVHIKMTPAIQKIASVSKEERN